MPTDDEPLDVLDLPQLYQRPSSQVLLDVLGDLSSQPLSWDRATRADGIGTVNNRKSRKINSEGVPSYLTKIISSPLAWIESEDEREQIWEAASQRLSERSGRTAMGNLTRTFPIPLRATDPLRSETSLIPDTAEIIVYEPAMTADNLGLKTWASSFLLAKRLVSLRSSLPELGSNATILELGAGTGLVGLAAAITFRCQVLLTDLPDIVPNLKHNIDANAALLSSHGAVAGAAVLDWSQPTLINDGAETSKAHPLILAADPIYSPDHPKMFVQAVNAQLARDCDSRVVIELPLREAYLAERRDLVERLEGLGLRVVEEGEEVGFDDWSDDKDGEELVEVRCWWTVWALRSDVVEGW